MGTIEFEIERTVNAPIQQVFDRLADIEGHNTWMPKKGSLLKGTKVTSDGPVGLGTTYEDDTSFGKTPGDVTAFEPPHRIVYHWWEHRKSGGKKYEGWPGYTLQEQGPDRTLVRHDARLVTYGIYNVITPMLRMMAKKERNLVADALKASFE